MEITYTSTNKLEFIPIINIINKIFIDEITKLIPNRNIQVTKN